MRSPSRVGALTASLILAGTLSACGTASSGNGTDSGGSSGYGSQPSQSASPTSTPAASSASVMTADSGLGTSLVDDAGMTLYLFTNDSPGTSTCEGGCLAAWPPLLGQPQAGAGADDSLLGTLTRSDGTTQVTYNGWPLYYWAQDAAPGDTTGQGVNGVWWVVGPEGDAIGAAQ
jgi:predicted lipoprotein with Yx(FWY)xxD motif